MRLYFLINAIAVCCINHLNKIEFHTLIISDLRVVRWYFTFLFKISIKRSVSKQWSDQTSDLGLHCLPIFHKRILVKYGLIV